MYSPQSPYTRIAFETIKESFRQDHIKNLKLPDLPPELFKIRRGCFVSLHKLDDELRGCIGTIEPREDNLVEEIKRNAISAAFHDHRFDPLSEWELPGIKISVDVLTRPEQISSLSDLDPQIYGLIVSDGKIQKGVLLPSIPEIDTIEKQIRIVKRKADLSNTDDRNLIFYRFTSNRYH